MRNYKPPILAVSPLIQLICIAKNLLDDDLQPAYKRDTIVLKDGGNMTIDWTWPKQLPTDKKTKVIVFHPGIGGSSDKPYVKFLSNFLLESCDDQNNTYVSAVLHPRGVGTSEMSSP